MDYPGKVITKTAVTPTQTSATGVWTLDDAAAAVKNNNWPVAGVPNPISKSLRFNSADSAYLNRTPASTTNRRTWTVSCWIKRSRFSTGTEQTIFGSNNGSTFTELNYNASSDVLRLNLAAGTASYFFDTTAVFRDPSAWYHIVVAVDTTQATASNRMKVYINGVQQDGTNNAPVQNYDTQWNVAQNAFIGSRTASTWFNNCYLTEFYNIDGQALTPSSFGMTDPQTGAWEPIKYTGTYGTNGFYLNFKDATSTTTLGNDYSGNANNWTTNNFSVTAGAGNDSLTDVPTPWIAYNTGGDAGGVVRGNYCTLNPIGFSFYTTRTATSNGNLDFSDATSNNTGVSGTVAVTSGKWYFEMLCTSTGLYSIGLKNPANSTEYSWYRTNGAYSSSFGGGGTTGYSSWTNGDVISVAWDEDAGKIWYAKNGVWQGSGNPSAGTNPTNTFTAGIQLTPDVYTDNSASTKSGSFNFGQRPFAYTPPAGFLSLCTTNLPNPTIGTSTTTQANRYFDINLYTGTAATQTITNSGFNPDFLWIKSRSGSPSNSNQQTFNAVAGHGKVLYTDLTNAEFDSGSAWYSTTSSGFTLTSSNQLNTNTVPYVAWQWNAGGSNATNTSGTITSTVRANTTAGFSIVTYTGNGGSNSSIGHGLGVAPSMIITKGRSGAAVNNWLTWHGTFGVSSYIALNLTSAVNYAGATTTVYGGSSVTAPNSTTYTIGVDLNTNTATYVAYCFAAVAGYSAFGSYTGNGSTDGPFVYTGFRPRWILTKRTDSTSDWHLLDTSRDPYNVATKALFPNSSSVETSNGWYDRDFLSNGFKIRASVSDVNASGGTYIYAAFAEFPFKFANAR